MENVTGVSPSRGVVLRPHQVEALDFLLEKPRRILGDEPGLGKTFPAIEAARQRAGQDGQVLVIVPPHLVYQWYDAIKLYEPRSRVFIVDRNSVGMQSISGGCYFIVTYNTCQNAGMMKQVWIWRKIWPSIILDEGHRAAGHKSQQAKNIALIPTKSMYILTGSPMRKSEADIFGLLRLCDAQRFRSYWNFVGHFFHTVATPWKTEIIRLREEETPEFNKTVSEYMLRRERSGMPVRPIDIPLEMSLSLRRMHAKAKKDWKLEHPDLNEGHPDFAKNGAALVSKLRRALSAGPGFDAKYKALEEILDDIPEDRSLIVFTWFRETAERLAEELGKIADVYMIHGGVNKLERDRTAKLFTSNQGSILIGTMASIGEGLNLQSTNVVAFFEHDYVPGSMEQAIARVRREGQEADEIIAYHIYYRRSVEENVYRVALNRGGDITAVLDAMFAEEGEEE